MLTLSLAMMAHSGKARFHVIIDTDGGPDDLRAISLILSCPEFEVIAVTTSDGLLRPEESYVKVKSLLKDFGHEGIPVAYGKTANKNESQCHNTCIAVKWGNEDKIDVPSAPAAFELLKYEINNEDEPVLLICMGPLTNISEIVADESLSSQISKIVWYCNDAKAKSGMNYEKDEKAAEICLKSGIEKLIISSENAPGLVVDESFMSSISNIKNIYAGKIVTSHDCAEVKEKISNKFYKLWDDLLPVFLIHPEFFELVKSENNITFIQPLPLVNSEEQIKNAYFEIINSKYSKENKVFKSFPLSSELYADDISADVDEIIARYGISEFRAGVLTNELHGHLGIYAIIGVKMGIRVRQYFNIGVDEIHITSFAGSNPPVSCMNDGLQVGTGATVGHGLINISDETVKRPEAIFEFKNKKVRLRLKDEYWDLIKADVQKTIKDNGNLTPEYWSSLRLLAIKYWKDLDRMEIFEVTKIS